MQSTNPIVPARRGSFALALAVTVASLIMGGEVALAEDPQCSTHGPWGTTTTPSACTSTEHYTPTGSAGATINIQNKFSESTQLYGSSTQDSDFWIYCLKAGTGAAKWYYTDICGVKWQFGTGCYINLSDIEPATEGGHNIYLDGGPGAAAANAVIQVIYWPKNTPPANPPLTNPPQGTVAPTAGTGKYAASVQLELTANGADSVIDLTVLNQYTFPHQLLYWGTATPSKQDPPTIAQGFNGVNSQDEIYTALGQSLGTPVGGYYPPNYPANPLMQLNGASDPTFADCVYNAQTGQWTKKGTPVSWGLPVDYTTFSTTTNPLTNGVAPDFQVAQNFPIDTGATDQHGNPVYSGYYGFWHPSKSVTSQSLSGVTVAQTFGNQYGGDGNYLDALNQAMPLGYKISRGSVKLNVDPGVYPSYIVKNGCNGYSFVLKIVKQEIGDSTPSQNNYNLQLTDIRVFSGPECGAGIATDPTFYETHLSGAGVWYPNPSTCPAADVAMNNPPRGRVGVPTDPLTCLLVEGSYPAPATSLSDQYDYPYVYSRIVVVPSGSQPSGTPFSNDFGPVGGPVLAHPPTPQEPYPPFLTDEKTTSNPHGTGRTFSPPGLSAFRAYLAEDLVYEWCADQYGSDREYFWYPTLNTFPAVQNSSGAWVAPYKTIAYRLQATQIACPAGGNPPTFTCPSPGSGSYTAAFCSYYYGTQTWHGAPPKGPGLKPCSDTFRSTIVNVAGDTPGEPFAWAGPFANPNSASIYPMYCYCSNPEGCSLAVDPTSTGGATNGWVTLTSYPKPLRASRNWQWPPVPPGQPPITPDNLSSGVLLSGSFNWDGSPGSAAEPALIKIGTDGYPEAYFKATPGMQWYNSAPAQAAYNPSNIDWSRQWSSSTSGPWFPPPDPISATTKPAQGMSIPQQVWGGGAVVPYIGNWTDYFVNLGGASTVSLTMYSNNYTPGDPQPGTGWGPCPILEAGSSGLFGFDPFLKATNWPKDGDLVMTKLVGAGVADVSLESYFSQGLIANMLADVSTVIQYGLLSSEWNDGPGLDYYVTALGTTELPFDSNALFQKPSSTSSYSGTVGNAFVETLLDNSLGYNNKRGGFNASTKVIPAYVTTFSDRFQPVAPAFSFSPGSSYFQWNLGVPKISSVSDIDGDGCVGSKDLTMLLAAWGACGKGNCPEDLNKDGIVEGGDLVYVLAEWGVGCGSP